MAFDAPSFEMVTPMRFMLSYSMERSVPLTAMSLLLPWAKALNSSGSSRSNTSICMRRTVSPLTVLNVLRISFSNDGMMR